jgi:hypothetical protein
MSNFFIYKDNIEGKVGIGQIPQNLLNYLDIIKNEYYKLIPDKKVTTYHTWFNDMPKNIKDNVEKIQQDIFWNNLCDGSNKCIMISAKEMDELYYSNPQNNLNKINLYGATGNYDIHKDCGFFKIGGVNFYRVLIGLTDGNDSVITKFTSLNTQHKIQRGDYISFDFDKTTHQVIKENEKETPRLLLKIHFIVCENCNYSKEYIESIKKIYLYYEFVTRYIQKEGTDPKTFFNFFCGLLCQYGNIIVNYNLYLPFFIFLIMFSIVILYILNTIFKIKLIYKNVFKITNYLLLSIILLFLSIVSFYWLRYKLFGIK